MPKLMVESKLRFWTKTFEIVLGNIAQFIGFYMQNRNMFSSFSQTYEEAFGKNVLIILLSTAIPVL